MCHVTSQQSAVGVPLESRSPGGGGGRGGGGGGGGGGGRGVSKGRVGERVLRNEDFGGASLFGGREPVPRPRKEGSVSQGLTPLIATSLRMDPRYYVLYYVLYYTFVWTPGCCTRQIPRLVQVTTTPDTSFSSTNYYTFVWTPGCCTRQTWISMDTQTWCVCIYMDVDGYPYSRSLLPL
jgi:hypothetical protein